MRKGAAALPEQGGVLFEHGEPDSLRLKLADDAFARGVTVPSPQVGIAQVVADRGGHGGGIVRGHKLSGDTGDDGVADAGDPCGDDGQRHGCGFHRCVREAFAAAGEDEHRHGFEPGGRIVDFAGESDGRIALESRPQFGRRRIAFVPASDEEQFRVRVLGAHEVERGDQDVESLVARQPADKTNDGRAEPGRVLRIESQVCRANDVRIEADRIDTVRHAAAGDGGFLVGDEPCTTGDLPEGRRDAQCSMTKPRGDAVGGSQEQTADSSRGFEWQSAQQQNASRSPGQSGGD